MSTITLQKPAGTGSTLLSDIFIDDYMPEANGEFVKVYIYLLRALGGTSVSFSLEEMADRLLCTERDLLRALKYWEKQELLLLDFAPDKTLRTIALKEPAARPAPDRDETAPRAKAAADLKPAPLTPDRIKELKGNEDITQLIYIAEQYLGKTLTPSELQKILFFYDGLHFSADLIEYLIEYSVSRNHKSMRYIETVAMAWASEGITTVAEAKKESARFSRDYFSILKALGITNRNPVENEITLMDTWLKTYGFPMEIIREACSRTVLQTGQASFQYTDKILEGWRKKKVQTIDDIRALDTEHQKRKAARQAAAAKPAPAPNNRFNNFPQREYDFKEMEKQFLNR